MKIRKILRRVKRYLVLIFPVFALFFAITGCITVDGVVNVRSQVEMEPQTRYEGYYYYRAGRVASTGGGFGHWTGWGFRDGKVTRIWEPTRN